MTLDDLLRWLADTKFAGYTRFQLVPRVAIIRCVSGMLDGTGDAFIGVRFARQAMLNNWTWEQAVAESEEGKQCEKGQQ